MANFSLITKTQELIALDKTEPIFFRGRKLQNACYFPAQPGFHIANNFGFSQICQKTKKWPYGPVGVGYVYAGWGHAVEAYSQAQSLARSGIPAILFDALEIYNPVIRKMIRLFLKSNEILQNLGAIKYVQKEPRISTAKLRKLNAFFRSLEPPFAKPMAEFVKEFNLSHLTASHPCPVSVLRKHSILVEKPPFFLSNWIPDHYGPISLTCMCLNHPSIFNGVFDQKAKEILQQIFCIPENRITVWGNQINPEALYLSENNPQEAILRDPKKRCNILLSTGGAGGQFEILAKFIEDFAPELRKPNPAYHLVVFTGQHTKLTKRIQDIVRKFKLEKIPFLEIFSCKTLLEVAAFRSVLPGLCPIMGAKSGEPALQVGIGYCFISFGASILHELYNEDYALKTTQAGIKLPDIKKTNLLEWLQELRKNGTLAKHSANGYNNGCRYGVFEHALWIRDQIINPAERKK